MTAALDWLHTSLEDVLKAMAKSFVDTQRARVLYTTDCQWTLPLSLHDVWKPRLPNDIQGIVTTGPSESYPARRSRRRWFCKGVSELLLSTSAAGDDSRVIRKAVTAQSQALTQAVVTFGQLLSIFRPAASSSRRRASEDLKSPAKRRNSKKTVTDGGAVTDSSEERGSDDGTGRRPGQL
uniref:WGS project CBMI000000000 data, contig CS3069_c002045 n=1 Tax=Fusarium clavum TaxID=2594811 RepID=A0A090MGL4_9HYPO|nr:unnamed protein product [Fusarium clavum]